MTDRYEEIRKTLARYEPDIVYIGTGEYVAECVRADDGDYYMAADVDAAIEALQAEIEALRPSARSSHSRAPCWRITKDDRAIGKTIARFDDIVARIERQDYRMVARPAKLCQSCDMRAYCDNKNWKFRKNDQ